MPRAYTVATAALALRMPVKWVDNILSHHKISGIRQERQVEGLLTLALAAFLIHELGLSTRRAIALADEIIKSEGRYFGKQGLIVEIDLPAFQAGLLEQLEAAVEMAPVPRRGRPPANKTGRLD